MITESKIASYCRIRDNRITVNGSVLFESEPTEYRDFLKGAYRDFGIDHPKFFKMDALSKLAFIASEPLLKAEVEKNIALVFANRASSLETDRLHQQSIADPGDAYPSPAVFVCTLPNICMGEISIRHKIYSENAFFIADQLPAGQLLDYSQALLDQGGAAKVLCGWVDIDNGIYDAFLYVVGNKGNLAHSISEITRLYQTNERLETGIEGENH